MEKYGVVEEEKESKEASDKTACPKCNSKKIEKHGNVKICPECGTEPFESKDTGDDRKED